MQPDTRPLPKYVARKIVKGQTYYYFRWRDIYRRLPGRPGTDEFRTEYARAFASLSPETEKPLISGSIRDMI